MLAQYAETETEASRVVYINSKDATLYAGTFKDSNKSTALSSNGVENNVILFFFA